MFKGELHPKPKLSMFVHYLKIINTFIFFEKQCVIVLKQIVWETQKWYQNLSRPGDSKVIDKNIQSFVFINNTRTIWPTKTLTPSLSFSDNLLENAFIIFQKESVKMLKHAQFWWGQFLLQGVPGGTFLRRMFLIAWYWFSHIKIYEIVYKLP